MARFMFCLLTALLNCDAYKILIISPIPSNSHNILGHGLVKHLTKAGHQVTYVTSMPTNKPWPNVREIDVGEKIRSFLDEYVNVQGLIEKKHTFDRIPVIKAMHDIFVMTLENDNMQKVMNDPEERFDLIIAEWMFGDLFVGLSAVFDCPFIWFSTTEPHWMILSTIDELLNPAYNPDIMSANIVPFSFVQRLQELYFLVDGLLRHYFEFRIVENVDYERIIAPIVRRRGKPVPSFEELRNNVSLVLGNSHVSLGHATRLPQNYKPISGYHIEADTKPLPRDLQTLMDNSKNGVVYFSLGSNLKSKQLPLAIKTALLKIFGELKQTVIWKFEEDLPNPPKNVHIVQWAPQQSILAHPNCALFITHGGYLSLTEAVHFGVPIIGMPAFGDQFNNIEGAVGRGYALRVDLSYGMAEDLKAAITEILTLPKYKERVKQLSLIYHDRPVPPGDEVVHWAEHVIRTRGAPHLRSPALLLPWYQKLYLDLAVLLLAISVVCKILFKRLLLTLWRIRSNSEKKRK